MEANLGMTVKKKEKNGYKKIHINKPRSFQKWLIKMSSILEMTLPEGKINLDISTMKKFVRMLRPLLQVKKKACNT